MVVRGTERVTIGTAVPGTGTALWVQVEPVTEGPVTPEATELSREYRPSSRTSSSPAAPAAWPNACAT